MEKTRYDTHTREISEIIANVTLSEPRGSSAHFQIKLHDSPHALTELKSKWDDLVIRSKTPICMSFMWINKWWEHFGQHKHRSLYIITVWRGEKLVAIAPMYEGRSAIFGKTAYRRLQLIGSGGKLNEQLGFTDDYGISDTLDFIVDPDYTSPVSELLSGWCKLTLSDFDTITFHQAQDDSFIKKHLYPKLKETDLKIDLEHTDTRPIVHLDGISSMKEYINKQKSSARRRLRKTRKAMKPGKQIAIRDFHSLNEVDEAMDVIIDLHQQRWNSQGYPGMFYDQRFTNFFKDIVRTSYINNKLYFKHTTDEAGISSSRLLLYFNRRYYDYLSGIDITSPSSKYRPGYALLIDVIEKGINSKKIEAIDLLRGEEYYKFDFTDETVKNWKIVLHKSEKQTLGKRMSHGFIHTMSHIYSRATTEKKLLGQQYRNVGFPKMFVSYSQHRLGRLQSKLKGE